MNPTLNALIYFILTCLGSSVSALASAQSKSPENLAELKLAVEAIRQTTGAPAIGIALVDKNGPLWVDGLGVADRDRSKAATPETLFRVGSISKTFTAFAIMQLVDEGKLSLEDKLYERLPDLVYQNPWRNTDPIRIAHLLEHTTGWDVHTGEYAIDVDDTISLKDALNLHTRARVSRWVPGTRQSYSNTGPVVAARIVEEVTGLSFEAYMQQAVFAPLSMLRSSFIKTKEFDEYGAKGYSSIGPVDYAHMYSRPSSTLHTSPAAMANVLTMLLNRGRFNDKAFITPTSLSRMETPKTTLGDRAGIHSGYGLAMDAFGFADSNTTFYGHTGGVPGFAAEMIYQPEQGLGYAFMINQDNPQAFHQLSNLLRAYLLKDQQQHAPTSAPLPSPYKQLGGFYTPISPAADFARIATDITDVMRIETDDQYLHRSPFFGSWRSDDYLPVGANPSVLFSKWSGLPAITNVIDPLNGPALQIEGVLYQKTSPLIVYGRLIALAICLLLVVSSLVYGAILLIKRLTTHQKPGLPTVYPILLSILLLSVPFYLLVTKTDLKLIFLSGPLVILIFAVSALYLLGPAIGWWLCLHQRRSSQRASIYPQLVLAAHTFITIYLAAYGLLPLNLWA